MKYIRCHIEHMSNQSSSKWVLLPLQPPQTVNTILLPAPKLSQEDLRKRQVMEKLFQVGVIFKHKGSRVLWEVIGTVENNDGSIKFAKLKSKKSGYVKYVPADQHSYETLDLYEAPEALKILFGDPKHVKANPPTPTTNPQEVEQAFDLELSEEEILEIDPSES